MPLKIKLKGKATRTDDDSRTKFSHWHPRVAQGSSGFLVRTKMCGKLRGWIAQAAQINYSSHALRLGGLGTMTGAG
jgi:hypothetical protein